MYEIKLTEVPNMLAVTLRTSTTMEHMGESMSKFYGEIWEHISKNGAEPLVDGCFALYHGEFNPQNIDVECGFSIKKAIPDGGRVKCREVEGGLMVSAIHMGPYDGLCNAYDAVIKWTNENGYEMLQPWRDFYYNDPAAVPENEIKTEVFCPVVKK